MHRTFIGIGSNMEARQNLTAVIQRLMSLVERLDVSRVFETQPVGISSDQPFLNCAVCLYAEYPDPELKQRLNTIEVMLGRDRADEKRDRKDRPADLDILFEMDADQTQPQQEQIPKEAYIRPAVFDLLGSAQHSRPSMWPTVALRFCGQTIGERPVTLIQEQGGEMIVRAWTPREQSA